MDQKVLPDVQKCALCCTVIADAGKTCDVDTWSNMLYNFLGLSLSTIIGNLPDDSLGDLLFCSPCAGLCDQVIQFNTTIKCLTKALNLVKQEMTAKIKISKSFKSNRRVGNVCGQLIRDLIGGMFVVLPPLPLREERKYRAMKLRKTSYCPGSKRLNGSNCDEPDTANSVPGLSDLKVKDFIEIAPCGMRCECGTCEECCGQGEADDQTFEDNHDDLDYHPQQDMDCSEVIDEDVNVNCKAVRNSAGPTKKMKDSNPEAIIPLAEGYRCGFCLEDEIIRDFRLLHRLKAHVTKVHTGPSMMEDRNPDIILPLAEGYRCGVCLENYNIIRDFRKRDSLKAHVKRNHRDVKFFQHMRTKKTYLLEKEGQVEFEGVQITKIKDGCYKCGVCLDRRTWLSANSIIRHIRRCHRALDRDIVSNEPSVNKGSDEEFGTFKNFHCFSCNGWKILLHGAKIDKPAFDKIKNITVVTKTNDNRMFAHGVEIIKSADHTYNCSVCPDKPPYKTPTSVAMHIRVHHVGPDETWVVCKFCGKKFSSEGWLTEHLQIHNTERRHMCHVCGKTFKTNAALGGHKLTHDESLKKFSCGFCEKRFIRVRDKVVHERSHTKDRPFVCEICCRRFKVLHSLNIHRKTHEAEDPFECTKCFVRFSDERKLLRHIASNHKENLQEIQPQLGEEIQVSFDSESDNVLTFDIIPNE